MNAARSVFILGGAAAMGLGMMTGGCSSAGSDGGAPQAGASSSGSADAATSAEGGEAGTSSGSSEAGGDTGAVDGAPTANSAAAATATVADNRLCTILAPFYWEIGDQNGTQVSGSPVGDGGATVEATTKLSVASASKWIYGMYVVETRGSVASLLPAEIPFMNFTSGYTNMGSDTQNSQCPSTDSPDTVNTCLLLLNAANNLPYDYQNPATIGRFDYDSGHEENHAHIYGNVGDVPKESLGSTIAGMLGAGVSFTYSEPLLAGGADIDGTTYATVLRHVVDGSLAMHDALGTNAVCTYPSSTCNAYASPIPEAWHYSIGHWVEDDPSTHGDGAFSSPGAFGFYPWVEAGKQYYGVISRAVNSQSTIQEGYASEKCGRLVRRAWDTGVEQTGTIPD
jgi:hypothetical protein